jgi:hypothetical protein
MDRKGAGKVNKFADFIVLALVKDKNPSFLYWFELAQALSFNFWYICIALLADPGPRVFYCRIRNTVSWIRIQFN